MLSDFQLKPDIQKKLHYLEPVGWSGVIKAKLRLLSLIPDDCQDQNMVSY